jgi:hypothetical protein
MQVQNMSKLVNTLIHFEITKIYLKLSSLTENGDVTSTVKGDDRGFRVMLTSVFYYGVFFFLISQNTSLHEQVMTKKRLLCITRRFSLSRYISYWVIALFS